MVLKVWPVVKLHPSVELNESPSIWTNTGATVRRSLYFLLLIPATLKALISKF